MSFAVFSGHVLVTGVRFSREPGRSVLSEDPNENSFFIEADFLGYRPNVPF